MANEGSVKLKLGPASWQIDEFNPSVEGVPVLSHEYQDVPANQEETVRQAAKRSGLTISKEGS